jgi:hypothetical protein
MSQEVEYQDIKRPKQTLQIGQVVWCADSSMASTDSRVGSGKAEHGKIDEERATSALGKWNNTKNNTTTNKTGHLRI